MTENIYSAPESALEEPQENDLASRWARFFASMVDGILIGIITMPIFFYYGGFEIAQENGGQLPLMFSIVFGIFGLFVFILIHGYFLAKSGQTVGKKLLKIKIVNLDNQKPSINKLFTRYFIYLVPQNIPLIGQLFSFINILFIFGKQKRCIHDLAAKTKVVKC